MPRPFPCARALLPVFVASAALAQDAARAVSAEPTPQATVFRSQSDWVLQVEPMAWYAAPGGELRLPGGGDKLGFEQLNLDSPRWTPAIELNVREGDWRFAVSAARFATDDRGVVAEDAGQIGGLGFDAGDALTSSMDYTTAEISAGYSFFRRKLSERKKGGFNYVASAEVLGGVRVHDVSFDISGAGGSASSDEFFAEPFGGLRFGVDLAENFSIDVTMTLGAFSDGGDRQAFSWDSVAGFQWYPARNIAVEVGYRQLAVSLRSGSDDREFEWTGATAGLFAGLSIRY